MGRGRPSAQQEAVSVAPPPSPPVFQGRPCHSESSEGGALGPGPTYCKEALVRTPGREQGVGGGENSALELHLCPSHPSPTPSIWAVLQKRWNRCRSGRGSRSVVAAGQPVAPSAGLLRERPHWSLPQEAHTREMPWPHALSPPPHTSGLPAGLSHLCLHGQWRQDNTATCRESPSVTQ